MIDVYQKIADILEEDCWKPGNYFTSFIVKIKQKYDIEKDYEIINVYVDWNFDEGFAFDFDFWEGQQYVELLGFERVEEIKISDNAKYIVSDGNVGKESNIFEMVLEGRNNNDKSKGGKK